MSRKQNWLTLCFTIIHQPKILACMTHLSSLPETRNSTSDAPCINTTYPQWKTNITLGQSQPWLRSVTSMLLLSLKTKRNTSLYFYKTEVTVKASPVPSYIPSETANAAYSHGTQMIKTSLQQSSTIAGYHFKKKQNKKAHLISATEPNHREEQPFNPRKHDDNCTERIYCVPIESSQNGTACPLPPTSSLYLK